MWPVRGISGEMPYSRINLKLERTQAVCINIPKKSCTEQQLNRWGPQEISKCHADHRDSEEREGSELPKRILPNTLFGTTEPEAVPPLKNEGSYTVHGLQ